MKRVNSVVTATDMTVILLAANSAAKRISSGNGRISPEDSPAPESNVAGDRDSGEVEVFPVGREMKYRLACRSRKPSLATIMEEPVSSR
uniref:Putative ovule protein n=1 Tax=Solanum chacoense TaxID=4108 RepID=A0A0V0GQ72_SOLCH